MKLKKLLPLAGLTGIAAVAAPLVTSCADKGTAITWETGDADIAIVSVDAEDVKFASETKMLEGYLSAIDVDKTIMSKDIVVSVLNIFGPDTNDEAELKSISVRTDKVDAEKHLATIHASMEFKVIPAAPGSKSYTFNVEWTAKNMEYVGSIETESDATNVVFEPKLCYVTSKPEFFDYKVELSKDEKWSFEMKQSTSLGTSVELKLNHSNIADLTQDWEGTLLQPSHEFTGVHFTSTYYKNATIGE